MATISTQTAPVNSQPVRPSPVRNIVLLLISVLILAASVWVLLNRQYVIDEIRLARYTPSGDITNIIAATSMQGIGRRYFLSSQPAINTRQTFSENCSDRGEQTIVLGCYKGLDIYIFNVTDPRLPGVKEVTAAHEMLHAAYDRLSSDEKRTVDALVQAEVNKITDPRLLELAKQYASSEPGELPNEMHSIIGTEVRGISPELERYYGRYFTDRAKVVKLSEGYEKVFNDLKAQQTALSSELDRLNGDISRRSVALNKSIQQLNADIASFNKKANNGDFTSQSDFQSQRSELAARQASLSSEGRAINLLINRFNTIRQQLMDLNLQAQSLNKSLDSMPDAVPSL